MKTERKKRLHQTFVIMDALVASGEIRPFLMARSIAGESTTTEVNKIWATGLDLYLVLPQVNLYSLKKQNCTDKRIFCLELYIFLKQYQICFLLYLVANGPKISLQQVRTAIMPWLHTSYISPTTGNRTALSKNNSVPAAFPCSQAQETLSPFMLWREDLA